MSLSLRNQGDTSTTQPVACAYRCTGKERDTESGNDYFGARYYSSAMGRFMSPDWSAKAQPVPYAKMDNPQTLNLYAYMRNNPLGGTDPDGHCDWCDKLWNSAKQGAQNLAASATTTLAAGVARISPSAARKIWEAANPGQKVPFDAARGRFFDMAHIKALANGGTNAAENLKPQEHGEHMAEHSANGDFSRWASNAKDTIVNGAKAAGEELKADAKESAEAVVSDVKAAGSEVMANPVEAVKDAVTTVVQAEENGEIPPP
jgi:RHS repeat-associated protein